MAPHLRKQLVVVGHGMVGHRFVESAISRGLTETYDITVIGEEPRPAYDRVALTSFFEAGAICQRSSKKKMRTLRVRTLRFCASTTVTPRTS